MRMPCAQPIAFLVSGLSFLQPALTTIQFNNMLMVATALVLGSGFNLSRINQMWLKRKAISTLSYFLSDAKISPQERAHSHFPGFKKAYLLGQKA